MVKTPIRFCPSLKIYRGGFIHFVKKGRGYFILVAKNMGGDYIHLYKNDQGGFYPGGGGGDFVRIPCFKAPPLIFDICWFPLNK